METQYDHSESGLELRSQDVNSVSSNAAIADDRLLWELLRLEPGSATPQKAVVPYQITGDVLQSGLLTSALVWGGTADAILHVNPFRAIVGSRTVLATDPLTHLRDVRSGYLIGASTLYRSLTITPNSSGSYRWDLVYATIAPDADGDSSAVKKRDPITGGDSTPTVVINKKTTVTLQLLTGTPGDPASRPDLPSDGAGLYHVPLAYLYVPDGFGATSVVESYSIHEVAPVLPITSATGVSSFAPANQQHERDGTIDTRQGGESVADTPPYRPGGYLPPTMAGLIGRLILIDLLGNPADTHQDGDVVDDSIDWRRRYFDWKASAMLGPDNLFPSDRRLVGAAPNYTPAHAGVGNFTSTEIGVRTYVGVGQSFVDNTGGGATFSPAVADGNGAAVYLNQKLLTTFGGDETDALMIYVRDTDGALVLKVVGTWGGRIGIWLYATGQYHNFEDY